jgi:hypothetical protein
MARVPAEPNRLSNQVLVHTFEQEWGRVQVRPRLSAARHAGRGVAWRGGWALLAPGRLRPAHPPPCQAACGCSGWAPRRARPPPARAGACRRRRCSAAAPRRVLVLGGGVAGLAAARALRQQRRRRRAGAGAGRQPRRQQPRPPAGRHGLPAGRALPAAAGPAGARGARMAVRAGPAAPRARAAPWPTSATCATARRSGCSSTAPGSKACCRRPRRARPRWRSTGALRRGGCARAPAPRRPGAFALPRTVRAGRRPAQALDAQTFAAWLDAQGLDDPRTCAGTSTTPAATTTAPARPVVSAWAGLHYFASRHGFHAPGDDHEPTPSRLHLARRQRLAHAAPGRAAGRPLHGGRTVLRVAEAGTACRCWPGTPPAAAGGWRPSTVVLALPLFVARACSSPPAGAAQAAALLTYAPWLVANLQLDAPLLDRLGAAAGLGQRGLRRARPGLRRRHAPEPAPRARRHRADGLPRRCRASERGALLDRPPTDWAGACCRPGDRAPRPATAACSAST